METAVELSTIAARVKWLRQVLGVTQPEFSEATGVPVPNLQQIEQGRTQNPGIRIIEQICTTYDVSPKWLILNRGEVFDSPEKLEAALIETQAKLNQAYQQVEQWKAEAGYQETINRQLVALGSAKPTTTKQRLGKVERVSTGSVRQVRNPMIYQLLPTLQATRLVMS